MSFESYNITPSHDDENRPEQIPDQESLDTKEEIIEERQNKTAAVLSKILESSLAQKASKIPGPSAVVGGLELVLGRHADGEELSGLGKITRIIESAALVYVLADLSAKYFLGLDNTYVDIGAIGAKGLGWASFAAQKIMPKIQELGVKDFTLAQVAGLIQEAKGSKELLMAMLSEARNFPSDLFDSDFISLNLSKINESD